jgi:branched-subunit amino acid transport protein
MFVLDSNPKIYAAAIAVLFGLITKNVIVTIFSGLTSYWLIIYIF